MVLAFGICNTNQIRIHKKKQKQTQNQHTQSFLKQTVSAELDMQNPKLQYL